MDLKLYSYFRSSASYRVRIALHWKQLPFEYIPVHLTKGEQALANFRSVNPMGHVPALIHDGVAIAESVAILDYLDHVWPKRPLFPADVGLRAKTLQICEIINSGIQPLQNLKVTNYLENVQSWSKDQSNGWVRHWIEDGLSNLEKVLETTAGTHALGGFITAADAFIIPQCFASRRFKVEIENYPVLARIEKSAIALPEFQKAHPQAQPDFQA